MKIKLLLVTLALALLMSTAVFADIDNEFILKGGDEYISTTALEDLGINLEILNDKVYFGDLLEFNKTECIVESGRYFVPLNLQWKYMDIALSINQIKKC